MIYQLIKKKNHIQGTCPQSVNGRLTFEANVNALVSSELVLLC